MMVPAEGKPVLIIPKMEVPAAEITSWMDDIRGWLPTYIPMWLEAFTELGVTGGTIGAELGEEANLGMPILDWEELKANLPGANWADGRTHPKMKWRTDTTPRH